jgi:hypothetical protein
VVSAERIFQVFETGKKVVAHTAYHYPAITGRISGFRGQLRRHRLGTLPIHVTHAAA